MKNKFHRQFTSFALLVAATVLARSELQAKAPLELPASRSERYASSVIGSTLVGDSKLESGSTSFGEVSSKEFYVSLNETIPLSDHNQFTIGLNYGRMLIDFSDGESADPVPGRLQNFSLALSYMQQINDAWSGVIVVNPGCRSSDDVFSSEGLGASVFAGAVHRFNSAWSLSAGLGFDSLAAGQKLRGALAIEWTPNDSWRLTLGMPKTALTYVCSKSLELSVLAEGNFQSYYVEADPAPGRPGKPSLRNTKLDYRDIRVGFATTYKFTSRTSLVAAVGTVTDRQFDYHDRQFKLRTDGVSVYGSLSFMTRF